MISRGVFRVVSRGMLHPWFRLTRGLTLGVRCAVVNDKNEVLLVRHGYAPGWLLPGGGVERGETAFQAVVREVREEGGIVAEEVPRLHGLFSNEDNFRGDHIACFVLRKFHQVAWAPSLEIREARFFAANALPEGTTGGTRRRIDEIFNGTEQRAEW